MIDLHLHTNMSDGSDSPTELLDKVIAAGCSVFSVTDHDGLRGNRIIIDALKAKSAPIRCITGVEISSVFKNCNLHLLCYGFCIDNKGMADMIADGAAMRWERITLMFDHLAVKHGIILPEEDKADILSLEIPGKVHITDAVFKRGLSHLTRKQFFDTCLDDMESREFKVGAERVIDMVSKAGGVVSFAHPIETVKEYRLTTAQLDTFASELKAIGLTAIEVYHSSHSAENVAEYKKLADKYNLLVSGGSDYHGAKKTVQIGQLTAYGAYPKVAELTILSRV
jgi:predicted metal-dependent phosphoesterase TrpH